MPLCSTIWWKYCLLNYSWTFVNNPLAIFVLVFLCTSLSSFFPSLFVVSNFCLLLLYYFSSCFSSPSFAFYSLHQNEVCRLVRTLFLVSVAINMKNWHFFLKVKTAKNELTYSQWICGLRKRWWSLFPNHVSGLFQKE